jgi:hypothetical protein
MDQGTPRPPTSRSSPDPTVFEAGSRIPSDRFPSSTTNRYMWTIPADSNSVPRHLPEPSSLTSPPSVPGAFESVGRAQPANYTLCSSAHQSHSNLVTDATRASSDIDQYRYSARGEQSFLGENKYPAQPRRHSSPESNLTACDMQLDRDSGRSLHASSTVNDTVTRRITDQDAGTGPPFPDRHEGHLSGNDTHSEEAKRDVSGRPIHPDANTILISEAQRVPVSPGSIDPITHLARGDLPARCVSAVPYSLESTSRRSEDHRSTNVDNPELASLPGPLPRLHRYPGGNMSPTDRTDQDLFKFPKMDNNQPIRIPELYAAARPPKEGLVMSTVGKGDTSHDENARHSKQRATPALSKMDALSNDISSSLSLSQISNIDSSASASPVIRPGLNISSQQDDMRTPSMSSTTSTGPRDVPLSDDAPPEDVHGPTSIALDLLRRQLTTCLLACLLWNSVSFDVQNLAETIRKCPQTSCPGQAPRRAGKRRLTECSSQSNSSSERGESGDESDHGGEDAPGRRRRKNPRLDDSPSESPPPLACPFHKVDPIRYSGLNVSEKEYRNCSSRYWRDISRLK